MRTRFVIFTLLLLATEAWGKTAPFYVPPVMRIDLDPEEWNLPYLVPDYFHAKSFQPGNTVQLKARSYNLEIRIQVKYLTESEEKQWATYSSDFKVAKDIKNYREFEAFQSRYIDVKNAGELIWISKKIPNVYVIVATNAKINDPNQVLLTHALLKQITWVDPREIDAMVGYPLDEKSANELAVSRKPWLNQAGDRYNRLQQKDILSDVTFGFSYAKYHNARLQIARDQVSSSQKEAYALGFTRLEPWYLIDSMATSTYSYSGASSSANALFNQLSTTAGSIFKPYRKLNYWVQSDTLTVTYMSCDSVAEVWVNRLGKNGQVNTQRLALPTYRWVMEKSCFKKEIAVADKDDLFQPPGQNRFIMLAVETSEPTPQGLVHMGKKYYFLDLHSASLHWQTHPTYPDEANSQMIIRQYVAYQNKYSSTPDFRVVETESKYKYAHRLRSRYDNPDPDFQKKAWEERCATKTSDIVVQSGLLTLDVNNNGKNEYWRLWLRNGEMVFGSGMEISDQGMDELDFRAFKQQLIGAPLVAQLLENSAKGYLPFSPYKTTDFEPRKDRSSNWDFDEGAPESLPFARIYTERAPQNVYAFENEDAIASLQAAMIYPASLKLKKIGGLIAIEIEVSADGKIRPLATSASQKSLQPLADEALRLTKTIPRIERIREQRSGETFGKTYILYYFQP